MIPLHPPIEIMSRQIVSEETIFNSNAACAFPFDTSFNDIFRKVKAIIMKVITVDPAKVTLRAKLEHDLGADSLDEVEIIMGYEKEFNIEVPDKDLCTLPTVNDAVVYIQKKLRTKR